MISAALAVASASFHPRSAFTPASLFASSEQGAWYDPSDLSTLFQDSAGTAPVTADGDPVGLVLDKRLGAPGPELVVDGGFDSGSVPAAWVETAHCTLSVVSGQLQAVQVSGGGVDMAYLIVPTVIGKQYHLTANFVTKAGGGRLYVGDAPGSTAFGSSLGGLYGLIFTATTTTTYVSVGEPAATGETQVYDNISVRELPGNHATQATAAARPLYRTSPSRLVDDGVDDALSWTAPAGDYTVARVNSAGTVTILTAQALSGATDVMLETDIEEYVAIDRALTSAETTNLTAYLEGLV